MAASALIDEYVGDDGGGRHATVSSWMNTLRSALRRLLCGRPVGEVSLDSVSQWATALAGTAITQEKPRLCAERRS